MAAFAQRDQLYSLDAWEKTAASCTCEYDRFWRLQGEWTTSLFAARLLLALPRLFWTWTMPAPCREMWMLSGPWAGWLFRLSAWFFSVVGSDHRLSHGCAACATDQQGIRCSHRGVCYDDKLAKAHSATSTKTVTKVTNTTRLFGVGNGSCICSQSRFQKIFFALNLWN